MHGSPRKQSQLILVGAAVNSPGGSVSAGMAIYDTMQYIPCDVSTVCFGTAASVRNSSVRRPANWFLMCLDTVQTLARTLCWNTCISALIQCLVPLSRWKICMQNLVCHFFNSRLLSLCGTCPMHLHSFYHPECCA